MESPCPPRAAFPSNTVLVTGSDVELGLEAAQHFVSMAAARVILADNPVSKGEAVRDSIQSRTFHKDVRDVVNLDMDDFQSVKEFTDRVGKEVRILNSAILTRGSSSKITSKAEGVGEDSTGQYSLHRPPWSTHATQTPCFKTNIQYRCLWQPPTPRHYLFRLA